MKLLFHAVKKRRRHGSVVVMRSQYISSCVMTSGRLYEKERSSTWTRLKVTSRAMVTGVTKRRRVKAVMTSDLDLDAMFKSQTRYMDIPVTMMSVRILMTPVAIQRARTGSKLCPSLS